MELTQDIQQEFDSLEEARSFIREHFDGDERDYLLNEAEKAFGEGGDQNDDLEERLAQRMAEQVRNGSDDDGDDGPQNRLNPNGGNETDVEVEGERVPHWRERAAVALTATATANASGSRSKIKTAERALNQVSKDNKWDRMVPDQEEQERERTEKIIERADLPFHKEQAYKDIFLGTERDVSYDFFTRRQDTQTDSAGGELLPRPFQAEVFMKIEEYGVARNALRTINMTSKTIELKHVSSKPSVQWENEGARISDSDIAFDDRVLEAMKLAGITTWTSELQEDADQALALLPILQEAYAERFSFNEDDAIFNGDGTSGYGGHTGLLKLSSATTTTMSSGNTSFSDITLGDIKDMRRNLSTVELMGAEFFMNKDILSYLEDETEGDSIVRSVTDDNAPPRLYGHDINLVEAMPDSGTSSQNDTAFVVLANPDRIMFGQRRGLQTDTSTEGVLYDSSGSVTFSAFQEDSALIRLTERVGYAIPGIWESSVCVLKTAS